MSKKFALSMLVAAAALVPAVASADITLNFNSLTNGEAVTNQFQANGLTFSGTVAVTDPAGGIVLYGSDPLSPAISILLSSSAGSFGSIKLRYDNSSGLTIRFFGEDPGQEAEGKLERGAGIWTGPLPAQSTAGVDIVDVGWDITKIVLSPSDVGGLIVGIDDLTLVSRSNGGTVPEPAGYALAGLALLAAGGATRRRRAD